MIVLRTVLVLCAVAAAANAREWKDSTGHYKFKGDLIAGNERLIVIESGETDKELVTISVDQLCEADKKYLETMRRKAKANPELQTWTMKSGLQTRAAAVEFIRRKVSIRRHRGRVYVNDRRYENLPGVYRRSIPRFVSHFEGVSLTEKTFEDWTKTLGGKRKEYLCEGVLLELENGDLYGFPFFFFSEKDQKVLKQGWDQWVASEDDDTSKEFHSMKMRAQASARRNTLLRQRNVAMLHLQLAGYEAGLIELWEVALFPPPSVRGTPMRVVVPARNSEQARVAALRKYRNYRVGPIRRVDL